MSGLDESTENFYARKNLPVIFGDSGNKEMLLKKLSTKKIKSASADYKCTKNFPTIEQVSQACAAYFKVNMSSVVNGKFSATAISGSLLGRKNCSLCCNFVFVPLNQEITHRDEGLPLAADLPRWCTRCVRP